MSCDYCSNLHPPESNNVTAGARISRLIQIEVIRNSKCSECQLIWKGLRPHVSEYDDGHFVEVLIARDQPLRVKYTSHPAQYVHVELFTQENNTVRQDGDSNAPLIGPAREVREYSGSDASISQAASWLKECTENHPHCQLDQDTPLPTRLIDVGHEDGKEPFLFETNGLTGEPYVALSYCWGWWEQHPPMKTVNKDIDQYGLKANYEAHKNAIKFSSMPKTIQDAVTICRRLGLRYLWVDALCIIQHDEAEWIRECGKMCQVYSSAALTISATHADGCSTGIFAQQEYGSRTKYIGNLADGRKVFVRPNIATTHSERDPGLLSRMPSSYDGSYGSIRREPLACRAWCMQESVLSRRVLHYTMDELVWECNTHHWCECGFASGPVDLMENPNVLLRRPNMMEATTVSPTTFFWRFMWSTWVHIFTRRDITNTGDKLPAMSGLAAKFSGFLYHCLGYRPAYLAGLWEGDMLPRGLCWYLSTGALDWKPSLQNDFDTKYRPQRPRPLRAPTWSFMSLDAPIIPHTTFGFEPAVQILEATAEPQDGAADPFGNVKVDSGRIVLRGRIIRDLDLTYTGTDLHLDPVEHTKDRARFRVADDRGNTLEFLPDAPHELRRGRAPGYSLLLVGRSVIGRTDREPNFLVLRPVNTFKPKTAAPAECFERVGLANVRALPDFGGYVKKLDSDWAEDLTRGEMATLTLV